MPVTLMQLVLEKTAIDLGNAADFGALAGGAISGSGDVGSGTGAIAPAVTSTGTVYSTGHAVVMAALEDFATAYDSGKGRFPDVVLSTAAFELGGSTLTPGVYKIGAAATLATPMTLDAEGDPEAVFIIQITGAFGTTAATGNVIMANEARSANVFWIVEGAVSIGANSHMQGNILGGAAITFGAASTISGRALAGAAAGTIALANTVSAPTGTPPVGFPPPFAVADTTTDENGNYLFEGVEPGTLFVRWDLSGVTTDFRITEAGQGGDDTLDSDSVSGEVGGNVDSLEIVDTGGSAHLNVDLGLVETLPAIKASAQDELATALVTFLLASNYTPENWTALMAARADGDISIDAATDAAGVAAAKNLALAAMDAVPTFAESLAATQATALDELATALESYNEADYTPEDWLALIDAAADGETAINEATDPAGVAAAIDDALAAMDAVPTVPTGPTDAVTPTITGISRTAVGEVTLELRITPNVPITIETSTDLDDWTIIATPTPTTEVWSFVHGATLATGPKRFYRAFLTP